MFGGAPNLASPFLGAIGGGSMAGAGAGADPFSGLVMGAGGMPMGFSGAPTLPIPAFAKGGMASGPSGGYPAMLHGTEAVVPLPGGRSLPVELLHDSGGGMGGGLSIGAIHVDARGTSVEGDTEAARRLGKFVGESFRGLLLKEMRPGGELDRLSKR